MTRAAQSTPTRVCVWARVGARGERAGRDVVASLPKCGPLSRCALSAHVGHLGAAFSRHRPRSRPARRSTSGKSARRAACSRADAPDAFSMRRPCPAADTSGRVVRRGAFPRGHGARRSGCSSDAAGRRGAVRGGGPSSRAVAACLAHSVGGARAVRLPSLQVPAAAAHKLARRRRDVAPLRDGRRRGGSRTRWARTSALGRCRGGGGASAEAVPPRARRHAARAPVPHRRRRQKDAFSHSTSSSSATPSRPTRYSTIRARPCRKLAEKAPRAPTLTLPSASRATSRRNERVRLSRSRQFCAGRAGRLRRRRGVSPRSGSFGRRRAAEGRRGRRAALLGSMSTVTVTNCSLGAPLRARSPTCSVPVGRASEYTSTSALESPAGARRMQLCLGGRSIRLVGLRSARRVGGRGP